jgi:hypothetical protein
MQTRWLWAAAAALLVCSIAGCGRASVSINTPSAGSNNPSPAPTGALSVSITAPSAGATAFGNTVSGSPVTLGASLSGAAASLQFQIDGAAVGSPIAAGPYSYAWDSTRAPNGPHTVTAVARDAAGHQITSSGVTVTVANASPVTGAAGPLRAAGTSQPASNYFSIGATGGIRLLAGSHTWNDAQDDDTALGLSAFDFDAFVAFLAAHRMNVTILWHFDVPRFCNWQPGGVWTMNSATGMPWARSGPGIASDGGAKFNLTVFNQAYFDRLRARVQQLQQNGMYAIVQLFDGYDLTYLRCGNTVPLGDGYPLTGVNNVNGIDDGYSVGTSGTGSMTMTAANSLTDVQDSYVRKVIDTLNSLPDVMWEISEEAPNNSTWWQAHMIALIRSYEAGKPLQHPIGLPSLDTTAASDATLFASNADWIAPSSRLSPTDNCAAGNPPCKVDVNDSDHDYYGMSNDSLQTNRNYLWQNFTHGAHVLFMDPYLVYWSIGNRNLCGGNTTPLNGLCAAPDTHWDNFRDNLGYLLVYANTKLDLLNLSAHGNLASTGFCLANNAGAGGEFLVYAPQGGTFTVNLAAQRGATLRVEWLDPSSGAVSSGGTVAGGSTSQSFTPPWGSSHDAVLYLVDQAGHG